MSVVFAGSSFAIETSAHGVNFSYTKHLKNLNNTIYGNVTGALFNTTPVIDKAQSRVTGKVVDDKGLPLIGVSVKLKGTQTAVSTDANGSYALNLSDGNGTLVFSYIGYVTREVAVNNRTSINVTLQEDSKSLDDVVVVGYGTQKKVNLTGSVDVISGEQLANRPAAKVADLLKGTSPNLNITSNSRGGEPGAASNWNIRGVGSLVGNSAPLVLVDGIEMDLNNVDPESIESVSVLKDASASAVYGSRAPFGVILITTKKGSKSGKINIQYNNNMSLASPVRVASQVNSLTWATAYNQASANAGAAPTYSDEQMERIKGYLAGTFKDEYDPKNPINTVFLGRRNGNANYDWARLMYKDNALHQKHNINVSGGNENTQYYMAGGFSDQEGAYNYGYDLYKRYNFLTNISSKVTNWLKVNSSLKYAKSLSDYPLGITTVDRDHTFGEFITWSPMTPMYNINGTVQNPLVRMMEDGGRNRMEINDFLIAVGGELEPVKGWKTNVSYNHNIQSEKGAVNPKPVMVELGNGTFGNIGKPTSSYQAIFGQPSYSMFNVVSAYEKTLNDHYFKVMAGYEQEERSYSRLNATGTNLITTEIPSLSTSLGEKTAGDQLWQWANQGIFGRLNYNFKEKYLLEVSARYNGSSRFDPDSRWGFFPSASAGYNISREDFWKPIEPYINMFKVRASYGALGNQNDQNYLYLARLSAVPELNWIIDGQRPPYSLAPDLLADVTWETITTLNFGLDAGMLNNRLGLVFDWYSRETSKMFGPGATLPYVLGAGLPRENNATLSTKGFELALSWNDRISADFSYNAKISVGDSKSTVLKYNNQKGLIDTWYVGKEYGEIWGFETDGLIQTLGEAMADQSKYYPTWGPGDMKYKDIDIKKDGVINDGTRTLDDHGDLKVIGNTSPRFNYGFTGGFNWKAFDFNMFWQGLGKHDYYPGANASMFWGMTAAFGSSSILNNSPSLDYWRPADETNILGPNTDAYFAKPYFSAQTNKNRQVQSKYVLNGAYLRLKSISLGYTLPQKYAGKLLMQKARIYMSGENLLTFTGLPKTYDPETIFAGNNGNSVGATYPMSKFLIMGLNLTF
ncbi:SusC/RagA family TonB-linked outer membrane protein [Pedobacter immunditicola]|uniref:SusC/RagA family TonB-linked outer membrane protein n=1 Tax=Pedobacter immunditicola TaxID=3133440 RepID=UPI0030B0BE6D